MQHQEITGKAWLNIAVLGAAGLFVGWILLDSSGCPGKLLNLSRTTFLLLLGVSVGIISATAPIVPVFHPKSKGRLATLFLIGSFILIVGSLLHLYLGILNAPCGWI